MVLSENGFNFIKSHEGCRLQAYRDVGGTLTIGWGHTSGVTDGMVITQEQADDMFKNDLQVYVDRVNAYADIYNLNQNQFDALVSFCYNIGNIKGLTNNGTLNRDLIPERMKAYCTCKGVVVPGLVNRRNDEVNLWFTPVKGAEQKSNEEIAQEVLAGKWGNGDDRRVRLASAGYDYGVIQHLVNTMYNRKSDKTIAVECIQGKWGNGKERKRRLAEAGYDYGHIQKIINSMLMH